MKRAVWRAGAAIALFMALIFCGRMTEVLASVPAKVSVAARTQYREAYDVLNEVNKIRRSAGLRALQMDRSLLGSALARALECCVLYSHRRANGKAWYTAIMKDYICAGDNIGFGYADAESIMEAWTASPSHRKNIMNGRYTCVGISCVVVDGVTYWAQEFTDGRAKRISCPKDKRKEMKIAVSGDILCVKQTRKRFTMEKGESGRVSLYLKNAGCDGLAVKVASSSVKYTTSNKSVVAVTSGGRIRAVGKGKASVKVRLAGNTGICMTYRITVG